MLNTFEKLYFYLYFKYILIRYLYLYSEYVVNDASANPKNKHLRVVIQAR